MRWFLPGVAWKTARRWHIDWGQLSPSTRRDYWKRAGWGLLGAQLLTLVLIVVTRRIQEAGYLAGEEAVLREIRDMGILSLNNARWLNVFGNGFVLSAMIFLAAGFAAISSFPSGHLVQAVVAFGLLWFLWIRAAPAIGNVLLPPCFFCWLSHLPGPPTARRTRAQRHGRRAHDRWVLAGFNHPRTGTGGAGRAGPSTRLRLATHRLKRNSADPSRTMPAPETGLALALARSPVVFLPESYLELKMRKRELSILLMVGALGVWACEDMGGGREGGMGLGRPDTTQHGTSAETHPQDVMQGAGVGARPMPGTQPLDTAVIDSTARVDG